MLVHLVVVKPLLLRADGPGVEEILMQPGVQHKDLTRGPLAAVQHNGGKGSNQAGPTPNGAACVKTWLPGTQKWGARAEDPCVCVSLACCGPDSTHARLLLA